MLACRPKLGRVWLFTALWGALAGCGAGAIGEPGSSGSGGSAGSNDGGAGDAGGSPGDVCASFDFKFVPGCDSCSATPLVCPCGIDYTGQCSFGSCLVGLNCGRLCRNVDHPADFEKDTQFLYECLSYRSCTSSDQCGTGLCVGELLPGGGHCRSGQDGDECIEDLDCWNATCVKRETGDSMCSDRANGSPCDTGGDCISGKCLVMMTTGTGIDVGVCSSGGVEEACLTSKDCIPGLVCVPSALGAMSGSCYYGDYGDPCLQATDCKSRFCVVAPDRARCSNGENAAPCMSGVDCMSGYCDVAPGLGQGICASGAVDTPCVTGVACQTGKCNGFCTDYANGRMCETDAECVSGNCALVVTGSVGCERREDRGVCRAGVCTAGEDGAPCLRAEDCTSANCEEAAPPAKNACNVTLGKIGDACGTGGACGADGACYFGKCRPKP